MDVTFEHMIFSRARPFDSCFDDNRGNEFSLCFIVRTEHAWCRTLQKWPFCEHRLLPKKPLSDGFLWKALLCFWRGQKIHQVIHLVLSDAMVSSNSFRFSFAQHKTVTARRALPVIRRPLQSVERARLAKTNHPTYNLPINKNRQAQPRQQIY